MVKKPLKTPLTAPAVNAAGRDLGSRKTLPEHTR